MNYSHPSLSSSQSAEALRLEYVTTCVGFDDLLDHTLGINHPHMDTAIVVTSHEDRATQKVAAKHGAICVPTDLFQKNGRRMNKGAAINAGFNRFQYHGWRMHLDADIALPDNFRRMIFNHTHLDPGCLYGADRMDVIGAAHLRALRAKLAQSPQHIHRFLVAPQHPAPISARYVDPLFGYCPIGFFQLWNASAQKEYPYSLGAAAHDDVQFVALWPQAKRIHLPTVLCYHLCAQPPKMGENWEGRRKQPRFA
jgi:hypothetical protein